LKDVYDKLILAAVISEKTNNNDTKTEKED